MVSLLHRATINQGCLNTLWQRLFQLFECIQGSTGRPTKTAYRPTLLVCQNFMESHLKLWRFLRSHPFNLKMVIHVSWGLSLHKRKATSA